jgi:hypothetical protein
MAAAHLLEHCDRAQARRGLKHRHDLGSRGSASIR